MRVPITILIRSGQSFLKVEHESLFLNNVKGGVSDPLFEEIIRQKAKTDLMRSPYIRFPQGTTFTSDDFEEV